MPQRQVNFPNPLYPQGTLPQAQYQLPGTLHGRTAIGSGQSSCAYAKPGYVSLHPPNSCVYQLQPQRYAYGFNSHGKIIGVNQEIPYPCSGVKYHQVPFPRLNEWYNTTVVGNKDMIKQREETYQKRVDSQPQETETYFTAENDQGYNEWVAKKVQEKHDQDEKQAEIRSVPVDVKSQPGHSNLTVLDTTNQVYGQYVDLCKLPTIYPAQTKCPQMAPQVLVRYRKSNVSSQPHIPNHSFALDPREMINKDRIYSRGVFGSVYYPDTSGKQTRKIYTFRRNPPYLGERIGERIKGSTWPLQAPTGLEINRPIPYCVTVLQGEDTANIREVQVDPKLVPRIYNRYMSYSAPPHLDPETEPNPAVRQHKKLCAPFHPCIDVHSPTDPCSLDFINPQLLPTPIELRNSPKCEPKLP